MLRVPDLHTRALRALRAPPGPGALALAGLLTLWVGSGTVAAQEFGSPIVPRHRFRIDAAPLFANFDSRYGVRGSGSSLVEEEEPLGLDFNTASLGANFFPQLAPGEALLSQILDQPDYQIHLGASEARFSATTVTIPIRIDYGYSDRLTVGVVVPFVKGRTDVDFSFMGDSANAGINPQLSDPLAVQSFLNGFAGSLEATSTQVDVLCAQSGEGGALCIEGRALLEDAQGVLSGLTTVFGTSSVFPLAGSTEGDGLIERISGIKSGMSALGVSPFGNTLPLSAEPLTSETFQDFVTSPLFGVAGSVDDWQGLWKLGDVEVHATYRLLDVVRRDSTEAPVNFRYQGDVGLAVRLGTGSLDLQSNFVDRGSGDGQNDIEIRLLNEVRWGRRLAARVDFAYAVQLTGTVVRRVAGSTEVMPGLALQRQLDWSPGNWWGLSFAPRFLLRDELALVGHLSHFSKGEDSYEVRGQPESELDVSVLAQESESTLSRMGFGIVFSTVRAAAAGRADSPFEAYLRYDTAIGGSGGRTPVESRFQAGVRVFWMPFGS